MVSWTPLAQLIVLNFFLSSSEQNVPKNVYSSLIYMPLYSFALYQIIPTHFVLHLPLEICLPYNCVLSFCKSYFLQHRRPNIHLAFFISKKFY